MYISIIIMLIVVFGAALAGKMLMDMYPDSGFNVFKAKKADNGADAD